MSTSLRYGTIATTQIWQNFWDWWYDSEIGRANGFYSVGPMRTLVSGDTGQTELNNINRDIKVFEKFVDVYLAQRRPRYN